MLATRIVEATCLVNGEPSSFIIEVAMGSNPMEAQNAVTNGIEAQLIILETTRGLSPDAISNLDWETKPPLSTD